jgi:3-hydroxybutyryl-CoA dehydrogenase
MSAVRKLGVCGAGGTMGAGIAIVSARAGFDTLCFDVSATALERARGQTEGLFARSVERGKLTAEDMGLTGRLGLGYADGPLERVERGALASHCRITGELFEIYGGIGYAPARRVVVAAQREER